MIVQLNDINKIIYNFKEKFISIFKYYVWFINNKKITNTSLLVNIAYKFIDLNS